jgi:hypothetical protein
MESKPLRVGLFPPHLKRDITGLPDGLFGGLARRATVCVTMLSRTCFGISKVANLLKSLDSESSSE